MQEIKRIISESKAYGWVLEPDAKKILSLYGIKVPEGIFCKNFEEAEKFAQEKGFPVVCKVVSPEIVHKSDVGGVKLGISDFSRLKEAFNELINFEGAKGVMVEKMLSKGVELIVGAKNDEQFGPVVIVGMGGVGVEIYKDTSIRMAPVSEKEAENMLKDLKCYPLLKGYRGEKGVNLSSLKELISRFSKLVMEIGSAFSSIDLNPVICTDIDCTVADARIIL